jgi:hypothetical protein
MGVARSDGEQRVSTQSYSGAEGAGNRGRALCSKDFSLFGLAVLLVSFSARVLAHDVHNYGSGGISRLTLFTTPTRPKSAHVGPRFARDDDAGRIVTSRALHIFYRAGQMIRVSERAGFCGCPQTQR